MFCPLYPTNLGQRWWALVSRSRRTYLYADKLRGNIWLPVSCNGYWNASKLGVCWQQRCTFELLYLGHSLLLMEYKRRLWTSMEYQPHGRGYNVGNLYLLCICGSYKCNVLLYVLASIALWIFAYAHTGGCSCTVTFISVLGWRQSLSYWFWEEQWNRGTEHCTRWCPIAVWFGYNTIFCRLASRLAWINARNSGILNRLCIFPCGLACSDVLYVFLCCWLWSLHKRLSWVSKTCSCKPSFITRMWKVETRMYKGWWMFKRGMLWKSWTWVYWRCNDNHNFSIHAGSVLYWRVFHRWSSTQESREIWSIVCQSIWNNNHIYDDSWNG